MIFNDFSQKRFFHLSFHQKIRMSFGNHKIEKEHIIFQGISFNLNVNKIDYKRCMGNQIVRESTLATIKHNEHFTFSKTRLKWCA